MFSFQNRTSIVENTGANPPEEKRMENLHLGLILGTENSQEIKVGFLLFSLPNRQTMGSSRDGSEILTFRNIPSLSHPGFLPGPSKCEVERYAALRYQHIYVPSCDADGGYAPVQCEQGGQCWCADTKGQEIQGTKRRGQPPACGTYEVWRRKNELISWCLYKVTQRTSPLLSTDRFWCSKPAIQTWG